MSQDLLFTNPNWNCRYLLLGFTSIFSKNLFRFYILLYFQNGVQKYNHFFNVQVFFKLFSNFFLNVIFALQKRIAKVIKYLLHPNFIIQNL